MSRMVSAIKRYPLIAFFVLAFTLSWGAGMLADAIYSGTPLSLLLALPFGLLAAGPLAASLIVSAIIGGKSGVIALLRTCTRWWGGWCWYAIALLLPPLIHLAAIYLNVLFGAPAPTPAQFGSWSSLLFAFGLPLVNPWDGPMLEELGWRGFALPRLQERYSPLSANLILGAYVAVWHLPLIASGDYAWIYIPGTIAATILFGWLYNRTQGSVLLTLLFHVTDGLLRIEFTGADQTRAMGLLMLVYCATALTVVLWSGKQLGRRGAIESAQPLKSEAVVA